MIKVFFLIFETGLAWERIIMARSGVLKIFFFHLLPLVMLSCAVEGAGLKHWGRIDSETGLSIEFSKNDVLTFEGIQFVLSLGSVLVCSLLIPVMAGTFQGRSTFTQAFTVVAYGLSPLFLFRLGDAFPGLNGWVTWTAGILLSIWILYQGIPRVLEPDPTHTFGIYLTAIIVMVLTSGVARIFATMYLQGEVSNRHSWFIEWLAKYFQ